RFVTSGARPRATGIRAVGGGWPDTTREDEASRRGTSFPAPRTRKLQEGGKKRGVIDEAAAPEDGDADDEGGADADRPARDAARPTRDRDADRDRDHDHDHDH